MKQHTNMAAHDGYVEHSHEVRPDHEGVTRTGSGHDVDRQVEAVLDVLAPFSLLPATRPGITEPDKVRVPLIMIDYDGQPLTPTDATLRALAEQIDWIKDGTAYRTGIRKYPVRHLLVDDCHGGWALWCSSGKGDPGPNPHSRKFCRGCKQLAQDAIDAGDLAASDVHGWPVTGLSDDDEEETGR